MPFLAYIEFFKNFINFQYMIYVKYYGYTLINFSLYISLCNFIIMHVPLLYTA